MKITKKIVGYSVNKNDDADAAPTVATVTPVSKTADVIQMHETLERPQKLIGSTYKLKTPGMCPRMRCTSQSMTSS